MARLSANEDLFIRKLSESRIMRNVIEILRAKEEELSKVKRQVEALRIAAPLLGEDDPVVAATTPMTPRKTEN
jgi:hypothetical protein